MTSRLRAAIPKLASLDIERSVAFFERLGFRRRYADQAYAIIERDGVQLHFWLCSDERIPRETGCRITVEGIDDLFEDYSAASVIHPNGRLELKPWGVREFSILDADGNLLTFQQAAA
jgi:catechol 2,3-dioxygenase-like lactoylglutathione lyase family enzyme